MPTRGTNVPINDPVWPRWLECQWPALLCQVLMGLRYGREKITARVDIVMINKVCKWTMFWNHLPFLRKPRNKLYTAVLLIWGWWKHSTGCVEVLLDCWKNVGNCWHLACVAICSWPGQSYSAGPYHQHNHHNHPTIHRPCKTSTGLVGQDRQQNKWQSIMGCFKAANNFSCSCWLYCYCPLIMDTMARK